MKLLSIYIMQSCNINCYYCPMQRWMYPLDHKVPYGSEGDKNNLLLPINRITAKDLLTWTDKYCPPDEWIVQFTGGEPGLHKEIAYLILAYNKRGYYGVINTNGTLYIPKSENFTRVTCWHESVKEIPPYHDWILLIKNPNDTWKEKEKYCIENNIPYKIVPFDRSFEGKKSNNIGLPKKHYFTEMTRILSMGQIGECYKGQVVKGQDIFNMVPPVTKNMKRDCPCCGNARAVYDFLPEHIQDKIRREYNE